MSGAVIAVLPNGGLGNKLPVWGRAVAFATINRLPLYTFGWSYPRIGPILRGERREILYGRHFRSGGIRDVPGLARLAFTRKTYEPALSPTPHGGTFVFRQIPHWRDYLVTLHAHRRVIQDAFPRVIKSSTLRYAREAEAPILSLHVRRGDFAELAEGQSFAKVGLTRTPLDYFLDLVSELRRCAGWCVPATIFSDGTDEELQPLLRLDEVRRAPAMPDVAHIVLLSRSKVIVTSAGSTFGMWAGFVSEAALIQHPDHIHAPIRPPECGLFEGPAVGPHEDWPQPLVNAVRGLKA